MKVFVYGSLMKGCGNDHLLKGSTLLAAEAITLPIFTMLHLGGFPGIVEDGHTQVIGELYEVDDDTLTRLDRLEGHPDFYKRKPIAVRSVAGPDDAEAYFLPKVYARSCETIPSGNWRTGRQ